MFGQIKHFTQKSLSLMIINDFSVESLTELMMSQKCFQIIFTNLFLLPFHFLFQQKHNKSCFVLFHSVCLSLSTARIPLIQIDLSSKFFFCLDLNLLKKISQTQKNGFLVFNVWLSHSSCLCEVYFSVYVSVYLSVREGQIKVFGYCGNHNEF